MPKPSRGGQRAAKVVSQSPRGTWAQTPSGQYVFTPANGGPQTVMNTAQQTTQNVPPNSVPVATPSPAQVAQGNIMPAGGVAFKTFETMTDDQKANVIKDALKSGTPMFLDDSGLQKFAYFTGMSDKPTVVTEAVLNSTPGKDLWRSVAPGYKGNADVGYSSKDIYNQICKGDYTNYSDSGGSAHGKAIYFDVHKGSYGIGGKHTVMHAKLAPTANIISESKLSTMYSNALARGDKLAKACSKADHASRENLYALALGYDGKTAGYGGYHMIFNRRCLLISDKTF